MPREIKTIIREWFVLHIKHRDIFSKSINDVQFDKNDFDVIFSTVSGERSALIVPKLDATSADESFISKISSGFVYLVVLNTHENINFLIKIWESLIKNPSLYLFVANPYSLSDKSWIVIPAIHNAVADKSKLKQGLLALAQNVEWWRDEVPEPKNIPEV